MASSLQDKIARFRKRNEKKNNNDGAKVKGIFHNWKDGDNVLRFVGEFLEVKTLATGVFNINFFEAAITLVR